MVLSRQIVAVLFGSVLLANVCAGQQRPTRTPATKDCVPKSYNSELCEGPEPQYPEEALGAKVKGKVIVGFTLDKDGCPHDIKVVRSLGRGADEAATYAVERFRFRRREKSVPLTVEFVFDPQRPYPSTASTAPTCEEEVRRETRTER